MKHFSILLTVLLFVFFSCNNEEEAQREDNTDSEEQIESTASETAEPAVKQTKKIVVNEPTTININDLEDGEEVFGLTISNVDKKSEKEFSFMITEEFILDGSVSDGEDGLSFVSVDPTRSNATLKLNDVEKPFFMWITFNNQEAFMSALTNEQKQEVNSMGGSLPIQVKVKNYKVGANEEYMYIGASADFVEIVE